eukprot:m.51482 g.51482  ORF g.51482 m.51482 type:complete len:232 (+) comp9054_c0_seq2:32-727(+)
MSYQFFVETDLLFSFALQSFARLRTDHHLDTFGYKQVQVPIVLNSQGQDLFGRLYDFTRIAGVTARALFIDATELTVAYPATASWPHNKATKITVRSPEFQSALNQLGVLQQEIYSRYDQMMPHYRLETEGPPFQRNGIIIASVDGTWHIYQVITNIQWKTGPATPKRPFEGVVSVTCIRATVKKDADFSKNCRWTTLLQLIEVPAVSEDEAKDAEKVITELMEELRLDTS